MSVVSIATLKTYFETGDFPTQSQFENLIDTLGLGGIVSFRVSLTTAQIEAGVAIDIPECAEPGVGYAWEAISGSAKLFWDGVNAFSSSTLAIKTDTASTHQLITPAGFLSSAAQRFTRMSVQSLNSIELVENKKLTILPNAVSTIGGSVMVYGLARIITI